MADHKASESKFLEYVANHGKSYPTVQEFYSRHQKWQGVEDLITIHNQDSRHTFKMEHNKFSDMTDGEREAYKGSLMTQIDIDSFAANFKTQGRRLESWDDASYDFDTS